jgi:hypothetical protein
LNRARLALGAGLAAVAIASVGCGGDDRLSTEDFQQQANAICQKYNDKIEAVRPSSPEEIPRFVEEGVPLIQQGLAELRALKPPEDVEDDFNQMLDLTAGAVPAARKLGEAAADNDAAGVQNALDQLERVSTSSNRIARTLGLDKCAES